jgi:hypothetical protein
MMKYGKRGFLAVLIVISALPLSAQTVTADDPSVFIGFSLAELIEILGAPERVFALRGAEIWQDDVVFAYADREFYFYRDRVWQIGLRSAFGIAAGEKRDVIPLVMEGAVSAETYTTAPLRGRAWQMTVRFNNDRGGLITSIFIYRSDF